ncbi:5'-deoxyadenosine deaminase [Geodia barretti]|uniref:5'-deoxyadenosine deaminase n=1 Tax=Geodia barretti TaxID=519541 RepID=A0AA35RIR0_GEOBA|nr:5'-deoxyadenosine deaminase [Geodia barretti]
MEKTIRDYDHRLDDRVRAWAMPFDASYSTDELLRGAKRLADEYGTGLTLHQINAQPTVERSLREHGMRPVEYLDSLGILGENVLLSHVIGVDDAEMDVMARTGATTVMCPSQTLKQATGITRIGKLPELLERGISVGLGTDAPNNSNLMETMRAMYLVAVIYKDGRQDMSMIPPETALELATIGGAAAFGHGRRHRLNRGGQEGGHGAVRHAATGVAHAVQSREQPCVQRGRQERSHGAGGRQSGYRKLQADFRGRLMELEQIKYWLAFNKVRGIGRVRFKLLENHFDSMEAAWSASEAELRAAGLDRRTIRSVADGRQKFDPDAEAELLLKSGVRAFTWHDDDYPAQLKEIYDLPPLIYVKGNLTPDDERSVAVVGTRNPLALRPAGCRASGL